MWEQEWQQGRLKLNSLFEKLHLAFTWTKIPAKLYKIVGRFVQHLFHGILDEPTNILVFNKIAR